jgi:hypothetical protein
MLLPIEGKRRRREVEGGEARAFCRTPQGWLIPLNHQGRISIRPRMAAISGLEKACAKCDLLPHESERSGNNQSQKRAKKFGVVANPLKRLTRS